MKKSLILLTLSAFGLASASATVTATNLLAFYDFNGNTNDGSGNGATGTLTDGAVISADGAGQSGLPGDSALDLGPSTGPTVNGARSISTVNLAASTSGNAMAVSFWQYDIGNGAGGNTATTAFGIVSGAPSPGDGRGFSAHTPWIDGTLYFDHGGVCCDPPNRLTFGVGNSNLDSWRHIVLQVDNGNKQIWIDGIKLNEQLTGAAAIPTFTGEVIIGAQYNNINGFGGRIDEFAIWDTKLEQSEIETLATGASTLSIIPEPSSSLFVLLGSLVFFRRRRR